MACASVNKVRLNAIVLKCHILIRPIYPSHISFIIANGKVISNSYVKISNL